jgi:hypothetical protein
MPSDLVAVRVFLIHVEVASPLLDTLADEHNAAFLVSVPAHTTSSGQ